MGLAYLILFAIGGGLIALVWLPWRRRHPARIARAILSGALATLTVLAL